MRPVLPGFHPDPSVCRVGDIYYLACSSFEYAPGVPVFRSADLRSWEPVGHALHRRSQLLLDRAHPSGGIYAPTLRHHDGRFWMITSNVSHRPGHLLVTAEDPAGPWSDPVWFDAPGIDPDLAWDEDGTCYVTWSGSDGSGRPAIMQVTVDPATGELRSEPRQLWSGTGGKYPEAPHLYRIGAHWYLLIAEGGTERAHAVTIARGPSPRGPFEPCPHNPVLTARGLDTPVQNTGHADLVQRPDGSWAMLYLGVRPRGGTPQWHVLGRETFASEIVWSDGWPTVAGPVEPGSSAAVTEELTGPELPASWVAPGRFPAEVLRPGDHGGLRLTADGDEPVFVGRRQEHFALRAVATVGTRSGAGGLELRLDPRHAVALEADDGVVRAVARVGRHVRAVLGELPVGPETVLELRTEPAPGPGAPLRSGPDKIVAGVGGADGFTELGRIDGRYLSTETAGGFTGRMIGLTCSRGELTVTSFTYHGTDEPGTPATPDTE
ncbi:glycoside hydrolase family 43 protein [Streptomyces sodiiphilus]|uniref:Glycoside hydrolase family 43 protein n=1 Tax=Streptomyces sodiiphilus TaxID=226217 RepID=A0ABN2PIZ5_9ACTN